MFPDIINNVYSPAGLATLLTGVGIAFMFLCITIIGALLISGAKRVFHL